MTDYRPFTIRRTIGGDVTRAVTGWHGALRYGPIHVPFDIVVGTALDGTPLGYDSSLITVRVPPTVPWSEAVLVRGAFGPPTTPLDGVPVWYHDGHDPAATDQYNQQVIDNPLTGGYWYYYTLFLCIGSPCTWLASATVAVLVPRNYGHATKLFEMLPEFYQRTDNQQAADGRNGPLRKFAAILGYDADYNRSLLDGVLNVYDPDLSPLKFIELLGTNLGLPTEQALGGARYRTLVGKLTDLEDMRGTSLGLQALVYAASNYRCDVLTGGNALLTPDDAEFVGGVGHWQKFLNTAITTFENAFSHVKPVVPGDQWANLVLRKYTGVAQPPLPMAPASGQGIMEIINTGGTPYLDFAIVAGLSPTGLTGGMPDAVQFGIPVRGGELWEFSFSMSRPTAAPAAQVIGSWAVYDTSGVLKGVYKDATSYAPNGYLADTAAWTKYRMQHIVASGGDGLTADPDGGVCGYIIPCIWWHSTTTGLVARYIMGAMLTSIQGVGGAIQPLPPDVYLTLGVVSKTLGSTTSILGPP